MGPIFNCRANRTLVLHQIFQMYIDINIHPILQMYINIKIHPILQTVFPNPLPFYYFLLLCLAPATKIENRLQNDQRRKNTGGTIRIEPLPRVSSLQQGSEVEEARLQKVTRQHTSVHEPIRGWKWKIREGDFLVDLILCTEANLKWQWTPTLLHSNVNPTGLSLKVFCLITLCVTKTESEQ